MSKVIIFPTDTVYGIGCPIFDTDGIKRIYEIKHRSLDKPLACLCASLEQIEQIAVVNEKIKSLIQKFMPGALTLILQSKKEVEEKIGYKTIGVRIPNSNFAVNLLEKYGPMLTTSVNESGEIPLNSYEEIRSVYGNVVEEIFPPSGMSSNQASTVVDVTHSTLKLLREGSITIDDLNKVWKD
ncbi:threonylcarbamoyl-AMP synthase [bacterium]|nr:threonylcarbamoyl-AMP synthase [bacterium]